MSEQNEPEEERITKPADPKVTHWERGSHFCGVADCRFGITDVVNGYIVSTVGDYRPQSRNAQRMEIGLNRFYETMVFVDSGQRCAQKACSSANNESCGGLPVPYGAIWSRVDFQGYRTEEEARVGHDLMVQMYRNEAAPELNGMKVTGEA